MCDDSLPGCQICNSSSVCLSCDYGYYLDSGVCSLCHVSLPSCIYCSDINTCQKC